MFFCLMIRLQPRSTRTYTLFPTRRSSDLQEIETSLKGMAGELLGNLRGRGKKERQRIASRVFQKINRRALVRRLEISARDHRSEEQKSELQSLMRITYAVFTLNKKTDDHIHLHDYL